MTLKTSEFFLSDPTHFNGQEAYEPDVAIDSRGRPWTIWTERSRSGESICLGNPDATVSRVLLTNERGTHVQPTIAIDANDDVWVSWVRRVNDAWQLVLGRFSADSGVNEQIVATGSEGVFRPQLVPGIAGKTWIVYEKVEGSQTRLVAHVFDGDNLGTPVRVGRSSCSCFRPSICADGRGDVWMSFDAYESGRYSVYLQNLSTGAQPVCVSQDEYQNLQSSVAADAEGGIWIAWSSNKNHVQKNPWWLTKWIYLRKFDGRQFLDPVSPPAGADVYNEDFLQGWEFPEVRLDGTGRVWIFGQSSHGLFMQAYVGDGWSPRYEMAHPHWGTWKPRIRTAGDNPIYIASVDLSGARIQTLEITGGPESARVVEAALMDPRNRKSIPLREHRPELSLATGKKLNYYFGDLHAHSIYSDATGDVDEFYHRYRDAYGYDFATLTDHDYLDGMELSRSELEMIWNHADRVTRDNEFVAMCGFEWTSPALADHAGEGGTVGEGHRHVLYPGNDGPLVSYGESDAKTGAGLLSRLKGTRCLVIPHHTAWSGTDWDAHDPEIQRLVEVCSTHGRFEYPGNQPIGYRRDHVHVGKYVEDALRRGYRLGFVGGSDSHGLRWHATEMEGRAGHIPAGTRVGWKEDAYRTGMTVVLSDSLSRESIFEALYNRRCYATSGEPIVLDFRINGEIMGSEILANEPPRISVFVRGTNALRSIEIIRNGNVFSGIDVRPGESIPEMRTELVDSLIIPGETQYYYLRVTQEDGNMAWSSPIWFTFQ